MKLVFTKEFERRYKSLKANQQTKVDKTLIAFVKNQEITSLRYHALKGEWRGHYSISAGGDLKVHLKYIDEDGVLVVTLGTHSQLYK